MEVQAHLRENIKRLRKARKLTQQQMADELGLERSAYTKIETGQNTIRSETVEKIARILGVEVSELYGEDQRRKRLRALLEEIEADIYVDDNGEPLNQKTKDKLRSKIYELLSE